MSIDGLQKPCFFCHKELEQKEMFQKKDIQNKPIFLCSRKCIQSSNLAFALLDEYTKNSKGSLKSLRISKYGISD